MHASAYRRPRASACSHIMRCCALLRHAEPLSCLPAAAAAADAARRPPPRCTRIDASSRCARPRACRA
eukprot:6832273-Prymnesium_polylepis.1